MPNTTYLAGATSKIVTLRAWNITAGTPYTAGAFNTPTIAATYTRDGGTPQTITLVTATAGTYTSSGFVHRGKGVYELGAPTASIAAGADGVQFAIDGITDVIFEVIRVELVGVDPRSAVAPDVNVSKFGTVTVTGRDVGASVLISSGAGAGQLDVTSGVIKANLAQILGTALTETAGQLAAAFRQFFNIAAPAATMDHGVLVDTVTNYTGNTKQTGDTYARIGAPAGASIAADVAAVNAKTTNLPAAPAAVSDIPTAVQHADALLARNVGGGSNTAPTVSTALKLGTSSKFSISGTTLTIYDFDGTTILGTRTITRAVADALASAL